MRVPREWLQQFVRSRQAGRQLALEYLAERADHDGRVRGYSKATIGRASGVNERQARNQLASLVAAEAVAVEAVFCPRQSANDYFVLVPWVLKARRSAELRELDAGPELPATRIGIFGLPVVDEPEASDPDPPPRRRPTSTLNVESMAARWREINANRFGGS